MRVALEDVADSSAGRRLSRLEAAVVSTLLPARPFYFFSRLKKAAVLREGEKKKQRARVKESRKMHTHTGTTTARRATHANDPATLIYANGGLI